MSVIARVVVGADGARSLCREAAGIAARHWDYPQAAIATRFDHTRPHDDISTEFHRRPGPLTTVPLPGRSSSLVWVESTAEADRLMAMGEAQFAYVLEERLQGLLGHVSGIFPRVAFPLSGLSASSLAGHRIVLVGEAGHRIPPIGAQGLNLGLRDVAWIVELVGEALSEGQDPGGASVLASFERARRGDVLTRTTAVDALNRSLFSDLLVADVARSLGIGAIAGVPWLRRVAMRAGVGPGDRQPKLLRPSP